MPDTFAETDDLEALLRRTLDAGSAGLALELVSDEIRGVAGQHLSDKSNEVTFHPDGQRIFLTELPVKPDTVEVTIDGETFEDFTVTLDTGILTRTDSQCWPDDVTVAWDSGFPDLSTAKRVCVYAAARLYVNPEQTMQKRRGDYSASYGSSTVESSGLTTYERQLIRKTYPDRRHRF